MLRSSPQSSRTTSLVFLGIALTLAVGLAVAWQRGGGEDALLVDRAAAGAHRLRDARGAWPYGLGTLVALALSLWTRRHAGEPPLAGGAAGESEQRYRCLVDSSPEAIVLHQGEEVVFANPAMARLLGVADPVSLVGTAVMARVHPRHRVAAADGIRAILERGETILAGDVQLLREDGSVVDVAVSGTRVVFDGRSCVQAVLRDVTDRKRAERHQQLLMSELDHRVKNTLAMVLSLLEQTMATSRSLPEFRRAFIGRVEALARTHEALAQERWEHVELEAVVRRVLRAQAPAGSSRLRTSGAPRLLDARRASPVGLALHELSANAAKHGALSVPGGRVEVSWSDDARGLVIRWRERGGPAVRTPQPSSRRGMGLRLIRGLVEHELGGQVEVRFEPTGFECDLVLPPSVATDRESTGGAAVAASVTGAG